MQTAAKEKTFLLIFAIASALFVCAPAIASSTHASTAENRAEIFLLGGENGVGEQAIDSANHVENYDPFWGTASESSVAPSGTAARPSIRPNDVDTYQGFKDRSVIGDGLEGHELLQHGWLKEHGHATRRLGNDVSKGNPVISMKRKSHQSVNSAQSGMDLPSQTAVDNILANRRIMLEQGYSRTRINRLTIKSLNHASENGL